MSVEIVPDDTISVMVTAALWPRPGHTAMHWMWGARSQQYREITRDNATEVGQMLVDANHGSYAARYAEESTPDLYRFAAVKGCDLSGAAVADHPVILASIIGAIKHYDYHASELPGWEQSEALGFCDALVWKLTEYIHTGPEEIPFLVDRVHFAQFTPQHRQKRLRAERKAAGFA